MSALAFCRRCDTAILVAPLALIVIWPCAAIPQGLIHDDGGILLHNLQLPKNAKVVGLQIQLNAGSFESISNVPSNWHITIDNSPSGDATLEARAESGTMALTDQQLLSVGVQIRRAETLSKKFQISGEYVLALDHGQERRVPLGAYNFEFVERYPRQRLY